MSKEISPWHTFPDEKPPLGKFVLTTDGDVYEPMHLSLIDNEFVWVDYSTSFLPMGIVKAWMEIPEYKNE